MNTVVIILLTHRVYDDVLASKPYNWNYVHIIVQLLTYLLIITTSL